MKDINLFKAKDSLYFRKISRKEDIGEDLDCDGFLVDGGEKNCRGIIASLKDKKIKKLVAFVGGDDLLNRRAIETLNIDYLVSPERKTLRDTLKQRDSGLNHVLVREAAKKNIGIVVDVGEVFGLEGKAKALRLGKIMQNVWLCRKVGCRVLVASFGEGEDEIFSEKVRRAFGESLGMSSQQVGNCLRFE